jgi:hypothetical protein
MTDIIDRSPMVQEEFFNKVADSIWLLMEQRVHKAVEERIAALGNQLDDDEVDNRIQSWMQNYFDISDYGFDITDYNYDIYGMIDEHLDDENFREKVTEVLGDITVGFDIK